MDNSRAAFESYMRRNHPQMSLNRRAGTADSLYQILTVRRNWNIWQAACKHALEEARDIVIHWPDEALEPEQSAENCHQCLTSALQDIENEANDAPYQQMTVTDSAMATVQHAART